MKIMEIEDARITLLGVFDKSVSNRKRVISIFEFFRLVLQSDRASMLESYLTEFIEQYIEYLNEFDAIGLPPKITRPLVDQISELAKVEILKPLSGRLIVLAEKLHTSISEIDNYLNGNLSVKKTNENIYIPLLECDTWKEIKFTYGVLDTLTIKIEKNSSEDKFIVVPSEKEMETRIRTQIPRSWTVAINYVKKIERKLSPYHTIIINFDKRSAAYRGDSLGIALAVCFIKELLKFYRSTKQITFCDTIALTGGLNEDGQIFPVSKDTIVRKLECVFYSGILKFVIHKEDEPFAIVKLYMLQNEFPFRKLQIIGVETLSDVLCNHELIELTRTGTVRRAIRYFYSPTAPLLLIFLIILFWFTFKGSSINNPAILENEINLLKVKNETGEILWIKKTNLIYPQITDKQYLQLKMKIIDINDDGMNEVLICDNILDTGPGDENQKIILFRNDGEKIWEYEFSDTATTQALTFDANYKTHLIDTITIDNRKVIYFFAVHVPFYASAVFCLDAKTGKRINNVFWHPGHLQDGVIRDFNGDGNPELVMIGINNGLERSVMFSIDLQYLNGCAPTSPNYKFTDYETTKFNSYVLLPKSDYNKYLKHRFNAQKRGSLQISKTGKLFFHLSENTEYADDAFMVRTNGILSEFEFDPSDAFIVRRDSLVSKGILQLPYTNTVQYMKILKDQVRYWNGESFTRKEEIK